MVETRVSQYIDTGIQKRDSISLIADVQKNIIRSRTFTNFDGTTHQSLYLQPGEIIKNMKTLLHHAKTAGEKTIRNSEQIIEKDLGPLCAIDPFSQQTRLVALKYLLILGNIASSEIKQKYQKGQIDEAEFKHKIQPIEGIRLSAISELFPKRYGLIEKSRNLTTCNQKRLAIIRGGELYDRKKQ